MAENFAVLENPQAYRESLLTLIAGARQRILMAALYLQDDDGGYREDPRGIEPDHVFIPFFMSQISPWRLPIKR